jgi:acetylornithine deacetylase/succinyl-diaminopimelate desuccinylase-like protein
MMRQVDEYLEKNAARFVEELKSFLRIRSVSADPACRNEVARGAQFVHEGLKSAGLDTEIVSTAGHPIVVGSWLKATGAPTVLVYGHYDVQPPDPLEEWESPPFEPTIRGEHIYARGATDDKGQMWTHVKSAEAWLKTHGTLPVNVRFVIEGEEEVGSNNLDLFLEARREDLACDVAVISDTSQYGPHLPAITYGLRGILACEVILRGPRQDLHSGVFGGAVANPVNALAQMIGSLHDDQRRVRIPGFYDDVLPLAEAERARLAELPFDERAFLSEIGLEAPFGETGYSSLERRWARPTCDVNGFYGGYAGEGPKTIVPARATAKISCRLVPKQDPVVLAQALEEYLRSLCPPGLTLEFKTWHGCPAFMVDTEGPYVAAARNTITQAFGKAPVLIREGGSIPVVATFRELLGVDTLLLGWGQNTDNLHSPNERFSLADYQRGIRASAHLWQELAFVGTRR